MSGNHKTIYIFVNGDIFLSFVTHSGTPKSEFRITSFSKKKIVEKLRKNSVSLE